MPIRGEIFLEDGLFSPGNPRFSLMRHRCGVLFQGAALWSDRTVQENIAPPLASQSRLSLAERRNGGFEISPCWFIGNGHKVSCQLSGGMRKRAGLACFGFRP